MIDCPIDLYLVPAIIQSVRHYITSHVCVSPAPCTHSVWSLRRDLADAGPVRAGGGPGAKILGGGPLKPNVRSKFPAQERLAPAYRKN